MAFEELKQRHAVMWGAGPFERIAESITDMYDALVGRLGPRPGERWLDVACGTGAVAERAASAGADVTGIDLAPDLVETARSRAEQLGLSIRYEVGDAENLPYDDGSYDVVVSSVGVMFAPNQEEAAAELGRVCRPGGRLGLTVWKAEGGASALYGAMQPFMPAPPHGLRSPFEWGTRERLDSLLADAWELEYETLDCPLVAPTGHDAWELFATSFGPTRTLVGQLDAGRVAELRRAVLEAHGSAEDEPVNQSRRYFLVTGTRRP